MTEFPIWRIRPAGADDADALSLVAAATFLESFAGLVDGAGIVAHCLKQHSAENYRKYLANGARAWLAEVEPGHAPVGYALLCRPELELAGEGDLELKRIYLFSRFQGSMMAGTMMRIVREAAATSHSRLLLGVKNDNHRALAFYAKHGFETIGTRTFDVGGKTYDDFVLALNLAN
ncbi:acetyltransferase (GNAT) family protein [Novosphingobium sp. PhB57]|jgi:ribosomal protein S18 acetylase RimI-like enzyme|uniref:GNAT family N-acetyltransferase n=1 Tax=unclassified Novosphingobium TaxID=2644732 RepID=UPI00104926D8|nr:MULTISPECIES: GNAT family N-acetyltransferase [unclassified Novosphingobium]TCU59657.1 acetyltransferase (GNAT) family protein [Novosphingobium sp. PhB57]TDW63678.1 acetyltransferase (GNAT) family protein [Novosphingobium sp. PhB55]